MRRLVVCRSRAMHLGLRNLPTHHNTNPPWALQANTFHHHNPQNITFTRKLIITSCSFFNIWSKFRVCCTLSTIHLGLPYLCVIFAPTAPQDLFGLGVRRFNRCLASYVEQHRDPSLPTPGLKYTCFRSSCLRLYSYILACAVLDLSLAISISHIFPARSWC